ncbi:MAG TPA: peptidoglycan-binding domain-containing protein [Polyangia bacterium]|nr:peptidoglycan-binding domain-containing protein [Polyangia bacterium]
MGRPTFGMLPRALDLEVDGGPPPDQVVQWCWRSSSRRRRSSGGPSSSTREAFQRELGLEPDGVVGQATWNATFEPT